MNNTLIVILSIAGILLLWVVTIYNRLTRSRIVAQEGLSGIDAGLQQRFDLIPNLVETVKGYAGHENKTLLEVIHARNRGLNSKNATDKAAADIVTSQALAEVLSLSEAYPDLKANENFLALQGSLEEAETLLNQARRYYNGTVREYNQSLSIFPNNLLSGIFGFTPMPFFAAGEGADKPVSVKF